MAENTNNPGSKPANPIFSTDKFDYKSEGLTLRDKLFIKFCALVYDNRTSIFEENQSTAKEVSKEAAELTKEALKAYEEHFGNG